MGYCRPLIGIGLGQYEPIRQLLIEITVELPGDPEDGRRILPPVPLTIYNPVGKNCTALFITHLHRSPRRRRRVPAQTLVIIARVVVAPQLW